MYLEISGRGTGKTYRIAHAVAAYLLEDEKNIANIVCPHLRQAEIVKENNKALLEKNYNRIRCVTFDRKNAVVHGYRNVKNFYDEFDYLNFNLNKNDPFFFGDAFKDDYYVTTPAKIRDLSKISIQELAKTDFLIRLLLENKGMYCSYVNTMLDPAWLKSYLENYDKEPLENFKMEIEGRFIKL